MNTCPLVAGLPEAMRRALVEEAADSCLTGVVQRILPVCGSSEEQAKSNVSRAAHDAVREVAVLDMPATIAPSNLSGQDQAHTYFVHAV